MVVNEGASVGAFVKMKIARLASSNNPSVTAATLAKLRRGIGKQTGSMPEIWDVTLEGMPVSALCAGDSPSKSEHAVYTALTLYALHQQGHDPKSEPMHMDGVSLGAAVRKLTFAFGADDEPRIKRRFDTAATSDSIEEFVYHLRGLIQLLKSRNIPLDYALLAKDLYWFQFSDKRDGVRLVWGRDYYRHEGGNDDGKE